MSRKPIITELQGLDNVVTPVASPVDAFAGAPAMPRQSSAGQLADALGTLASAGMKSAENARLEQIEMEKLSAQKLANEFVGSKDSPYLTVDEFGKNFKYLDPSVLGTILEKKYNAEYYDKTLSTLQSLPNSIRFDSVEFETAYNNLVDNATKETHGKFFVQSGAIAGLQKAYSEATRSNIQQGRAYIEKEHEKSVGTFSYGTIKDADLSDPEQFQGVVDAIIAEDKLQKGDKNTPGTSPFSEDRLADKRIWRDSLIQQAKNDPLRGNQILNIIDALPWSGDTETKEAVEIARGEVAELATAEIQQNNQELQANLSAASVNVDAKVADMVAQNDVAGLKGILTKPLNPNATQLEKGVYAMSQERARIALNNRYIDPIDSSAAYTTDKQDVIVRGSQGTLNIAEEVARVRQLPLTNEQMSAYIQELPLLAQGSSIVLTSSHKQSFTARLGATIDGMSNPLAKDFMLANFALAQRGTSFEAIATEEFNRIVLNRVNQYIADNGEIPTPLEMDKEGGIYDMAAEAAEAKLSKINLLNGEIVQPAPAPSSQEVTGAEHTFTLNGVTYTLKPGVDPNNATDKDWVAQGDVPSDEEPTVTEPTVTDTTVDNQQTPTDGYKVTNTDGQGEYVVETKSPEETAQRQQKYYERASKTLGFNPETAMFDLPEDMMAKVEKAIASRYAKVGASRGKGGKVKAPKENDILKLVLDSLGLSRVPDFNYGPGIFSDDEPNTAGEIAVRRLVDSMMEKYKGE
jgi:hypothetical protein